MDRKTAVADAKRLAQTLDGPFGRRKLQPVVEAHLGFFERARAAGATWGQLAELLAEAGARDADGNPIAANVWRAMMSRASRKQAAGASSKNGPAASTGHAPAPPRSVAPDRQVRPSRSTDTDTGNAGSGIDIVRQRVARIARVRGLKGQ